MSDRPASPTVDLNRRDHHANWSLPQTACLRAAAGPARAAIAAGRVDDTLFARVWGSDPDPRIYHTITHGSCRIIPFPFG